MRDTARTPHTAAGARAGGPRDTAGRPGRPPRGRARAAAAALLCVLMAGCGTAGEAAAPEEVIRVSPRDGARGIRAGGPLEVSVREGRLERVRVVRTGAGRSRPLPGRLSRDGRVWRPARGHGRLALAARYAVRAEAVDGRGRRTVRRTGFTTYRPPHRFVGRFRPEHRQTVGTAMIVSFAFSRPVTDRAAVERALTVRADPPVPVAAHWFGPSRLDFRPRAYWRPGTRVTVDLRLRDVRAAPGVYGRQAKRVWFTVGREQRSVVDVARHRMTVWRGGRPVARLPVTAGAADTPTYNGRMVVSEKYPVTRMNGGTVGFGGQYDIADVPHALRLTDSGTFLHGNYWAERDVFGRADVSHGCVGMPDARGGDPASPAGWFYRRTLVGDLVTVRGSRERVVAPDNGLSGWNMSWAAWRAGSALG